MGFPTWPILFATVPIAIALLDAPRQICYVQLPVRQGTAMTTVTYTDLRQNLARYLDEVVDSRAPLVVTRTGGKGNVVLISEQEFGGWQETVHLLSNPANAEHLLLSIAQLNAGEAVERELLQPAASAGA